jgi:uncharacterized protein (UPF0210 family)
MARAKPQRLAGLAEPGNLAIDFSDVAVGLANLDDCREDEEARTEVGEKLMQELATLPRTVAGVADLHDAIGATVMYGDSIAPAIEALGRVAVAFAGHSALAAVDKAARAQAAASGKKGGRPKADPHRHAELVRLLEKKLVERRHLSEAEAIRQVCDAWNDEPMNDRVAYSTLRDAFARYQKSNG